ncbi:MAG: 6-phosphogluconolactonase [Actinomycetota bacterium]|nr:6-phosphogluconolactonase [Actinomycetota bacterium]
MIGEVVVVDDVPAAYAQLVADELAAHRALRGDPTRSFRLACSGGSSGARCASALAAREDLDLSSVACYLVDERCVPSDAPESNARAIRDALGRRLGELESFAPMSCEDGPDAYEALLRPVVPLDLVQLGFGPDGHIASLFPGSAALDVTDRLVTTNLDPSGRNPLPRMTMTYAVLATAKLAVLAVTGTEKRAALAAVASGEDLPAARVRARRVVWLCDRDAAEGVLA